MGSFVVWLLIAGGMRRGTAAGGLALSSPLRPDGRRRRRGGVGLG